MRLPCSKGSSNRMRLWALALVVSACNSDVTQPGTGTPARLQLRAMDAAALASLGDSAEIHSFVYDEHGQLMRGVPLRWSVSSNGVVETLGNGVIRAVGNGEVVVRAVVDVAQTGVRPSGYWASALADSVVVSVRQRAVRLTLDPVDTAFTTINALRRMRARLLDARGVEINAAPADFRWESGAIGVLAVDSLGVVRSQREGAGRVSVFSGTLGTGVTFTVNPRLAHTACMVYSRRKQAKQSCVTNDLVVQAREARP